MNNESTTITANEINKYTYCPYQFYYERVYGQKYIRAVRSEMLEELGYTDKTKSNLKKGLDYHKNYKTKNGLKYPIFKLMILVVLIVIGFAFYDEFDIYINWIIDMFKTLLP